MRLRARHDTDPVDTTIQPHRLGGSHSGPAIRAAVAVKSGYHEKIRIGRGACHVRHGRPGGGSSRLPETPSSPRLIAARHAAGVAGTRARIGRRRAQPGVARSSIAVLLWQCRHIRAENHTEPQDRTGFAAIPACPACGAMPPIKQALSSVRIPSGRSTCRASLPTGAVPRVQVTADHRASSGIDNGKAS